jgi:hypothetical protein
VEPREGKAEGAQAELAAGRRAAVEAARGGERPLRRPLGIRSRPRRMLPEDPLVRWLLWFCIAVSIGAPLLAALVLALLS